MAQTKQYLTLKRRWWFMPAFYVGAGLAAVGLVDSGRYARWLADHATTVAFAGKA